MLTTNAVALIKLEDAIQSLLAANPSDQIALEADRLRAEAQAFHEQDQHVRAAELISKAFRMLP